VNIEKPTSAQNARGEVVLTWPGTVFAIVWGHKTRAGGSENQVARQQFAVGQYHWLFRYLPGVTTEMRINDRGVYADIIEVDESRQRKGELHIEAVERGV
jgi:head-tail adaptor